MSKVFMYFMTASMFLLVGCSESEDQTIPAEMVGLWIADDVSESVSLISEGINVDRLCRQFENYRGDIPLDSFSIDALSIGGQGTVNAVVGDSEGVEEVSQRPFAFINQDLDFVYEDFVFASGDFPQGYISYVEVIDGLLVRHASWNDGESDPFIYYPVSFDDFALANDIIQLNCGRRGLLI